MGMASEQTETTIQALPLLPLRDVVIYPHMVIPLFVGREKSIQALEQAMATDKQVLLLAQRNASDDDPSPERLFEIGTVSSVLQLLKLPDGTVKVLVEGGERAQVTAIEEGESFYKADVELLMPEEIPAREGEVLVKTAMAQFEQYVNLSKKVPAEVMTSLSGIDEPGRLADTIV